MGDVADVISGQSPEGKYYNQTGEGTPFYQGRTEFGDIYLKSAKNWTTKVTKTAIKGDILMSTVRPNLKAFTYIDFETIGFVASTGFAVLTPKNVNGKYLL